MGKEYAVIRPSEYKNQLVEMLSAKPTLLMKKRFLTAEIKGSQEYVNDVEGAIKKNGQGAYMYGEQWYLYDLNIMKRNLETAKKMREAL